MMELSEFTRLYPLRAKNLAWFFGAGSSVSGGIPTASELTWEFKRRIYCTEQGRQLQLFNNLSDPALRNQIQAYFDSKGNYPEMDSVEEYSFYFEMAYPAAIDRREFLSHQLSGMQNSFGHKVIGVLMKNNYIQLIYTTNFDKAFENIAISEYGRADSFFVGTNENSQTAISQYQNRFRPLIIKLHGDYFSEKLKNTSEELKNQDKLLRTVLERTCLDNGLAVMGYSGRDKSILDVLNLALESDNSFPHGLFWFLRSGESPLPEVENLIVKALDKRIQAEFIEIESFDTAWGEIIKGIEDLPKADQNKINTNYYRRSNSPLTSRGTKYPLILFNAIEIKEFPTTARLIKCNAGNTKEIRAIVNSSKSDILVIRKRNGIVGFGADSEFERVFSSYGHIEKDVYQIPEHSLRYDDSTLKGLVTEGLIKAISLNRPLFYRKRRDRYLLFPNPRNPKDKAYELLNRVFNFKLTGKIPNTNIDWIIALDISLQRKIDNYFLTLSPTVICSKKINIEDKFLIAQFIKEYVARWYNRMYSEILYAWLYTIFEGKDEITICSFPNNVNGYNPKYKIMSEFSFSKNI